MKLLKLAYVPFLLTATLAAVVRLLFSFDGLYGQDAFAYFNFARAIWPHLLHGAPLPHLDWPIGYPVAVACLMPVIGQRPVAGQIVSTIACGWAAAATSVLVLELPRVQRTAWRPLPSPLVAGLCVALSGGVLRYSQAVMADALGLAAAATCLLLVTEYTKSGKGVFILTATIAWAIGTVTRWLDGILVVPLTLFAFACRRYPSDHAESEVERNWPWIAAAILAGAAILLPQLAIAHSSPASFEQHEWLLAWDLRNAFRRDFHTPEGHAAYRLPVALFYLVRLGWHDYFFPLLALLSLAGAGLLTSRREWPILVLLAGWPLAALTFLSGIPYENPRFLLPTLPAIAALAAYGFSYLQSRFSGRLLRRAPILLLVLSLGAGLLLGGREHLRTVTRKNRDLALVHWVDEVLPAKATLLMSGGTLIFEEYGRIRVRETFTMSAEQTQALVAQPGQFFFLEAPEEMKAQWAGLQPALNFDALSAYPGLTPVEWNGVYTLFRVGPPDRASER
ncbi:MAG: hypothetical protein ABSC94_28145 [Polyangiaceae bacterium]|jgi:4-amino-4-deoxy-L-arabinose transferase-like glycosyltransferase